MLPMLVMPVPVPTPRMPAGMFSSGWAILAILVVLVADRYRPCRPVDCRPSRPGPGPTQVPVVPVVGAAASSSTSLTFSPSSARSPPYHHRRRTSRRMVKVKVREAANKACMKGSPIHFVNPTAPWPVQASETSSNSNISNGNSNGSRRYPHPQRQAASCPSSCPSRPCRRHPWHDLPGRPPAPCSRSGAWA